MTLDGKPVTLEELEHAKKRLTESNQKENEPATRIVEVKPGEFKTKTVLQG
ncbi:MAG: hypothetical protein LC687_04820 [Actinobacteria bacterium]|nr:hypothetical protein [Actinomycetota bacterium]MCA1807156.1 hypothetical protein [Actinomycetota bacterium]